MREDQQELNRQFEFIIKQMHSSAHSACTFSHIHLKTRASENRFSFADDQENVDNYLVDDENSDDDDDDEDDDEVRSN